MNEVFELNMLCHFSSSAFVECKERFRSFGCMSLSNIGEALKFNVTEPGVDWKASTLDNRKIENLQKK